MKKQAQLWLGTLVVLLVILSTVLAGCAPSPAVANPSPVVSAPVSAAAPVSAPSANNGPNEGIKVHGSWTIEVTNPDGTLASHNEFENSLTNQGAIFLVQVMGRKGSVGAWKINLGSNPNGSNAFQYHPVAGGGYATGPATIKEPFSAPSDTNEFNTLTVSVPAAGETNANKLVLSGTAIAGQNGSINIVQTSLAVLPPTELPHAAYNGSYYFTETMLANPVSLTSGQQVAVTVVISFS